MSITFKEIGHKYESIGEENIKWTSTTGLIGLFKQPFDQDAVAKKCAKNKKSKWYGLEPQEIKDIWKAEALRATDLGTFFHNQREDDLLSCDTLNRGGLDLPVIPPIIKNDVKFAPSQKLAPGVYPEHMVYLKSAGVCGQADYVDCYDGKVNILDYKTNKEIHKESYKNWEGIHKMCNAPLEHIQDCSLQHYTLQMSIYMYIILKHNPRLKPGKLTLQHVKFKIESEDQYGYPKTAREANGDPIVDEIEFYEVPYMKEEVLTMLRHLKENR